MKDIITMIAKRLGLGFMAMVVISILIFAGVDALPGDLKMADFSKGDTLEPLIVADVNQVIQYLELSLYRLFRN